MYLHIEEPARVREEREYMEHRDAHGPEAMRKKREQGGCGRTKQVDREMPRVQRCEFDRYESVEHLVRSHHGQRDRGHRAFGSAPAPGRIAKSNQHESEDKRAEERRVGKDEDSTCSFR